jgi:hypothetical protein
VRVFVRNRFSRRAREEMAHDQAASSSSKEVTSTYTKYVRLLYRIYIWP